MKSEVQRSTRVRWRSRVVELATREAQVVDDVLDEVDVATKLNGVIAGSQRDGIGKLPATLIRERSALEKLGHSERESHC